MIDEYLNSNHVMGLALKTQQLYAASLGHLYDFFKTNDPILNQKDLNDFAVYLENKGLSGYSVRMYLTCAKIYLRTMGRPVSFVYSISNRDKKRTREKQMNRWFSQEEIDMCKAYDFPELSDPQIRLRNRVIVRLLIETGGRVGEIVSMKVRDLRLHDPPMVRLLNSKTKPRWVPISPETASFIGAWLDGTRLRYYNLLFPRHIETTKRLVSEMLVNLGIKEIGDGKGPHTFRHYCATNWYQKDVPVEVIAELLGDTVETIRHCYIHLSPGHTSRVLSEIMGWKGGDNGNPHKEVSNSILQKEEKTNGKSSSKNGSKNGQEDKET